MVGWSEHGRGETKLYRDARGFLTRTERPDGSVALRVPDEVGNLYMLESRADRTYSRIGAVVECRGDDGVTTFRYDEEGNVAERVDPDGGQWAFHFAGDGTLRQVDRPDGTAVRFRYDPMGRRVEKNHDGRVTRYVWAGDVVLHEWVLAGEAPRPEPSAQERRRLESVGQLRAQLHAHFGEQEGESRFRETLRSSNDPAYRSALAELDAVSDVEEVHGEVVTWIFDPDGFAPIGRLEAGLQPVVTDGFGTPLLVLDASGEVAWQGDVDLAGRVQEVGDRSLCPWRFAGQYHDVEIDLHYNRYRYYDPATDSFVSADPLGLSGGLRLYGYVEDPTQWIDPLGLAKTQPGGCSGAGPSAGGLIPEPPAGPRAPSFDEIVGESLGPFRPSVDGARGSGVLRGG